MDLEQVLKKINSSSLPSDWKRYARKNALRDAENIQRGEGEVVGKPASEVTDQSATWVSRKQVAQILYDRPKSIFLYNLEGLRRRPYTHTFINQKEGNPFVYVMFEYCLEDAKAIRERWNEKRQNRR